MMSSSSQAFLHLRPSPLLLSLLFLYLLLHKTEGIRLDESFGQVTHQKLHEENRSPMGRSTNNNGGAKEAIFCEGGHRAGITRKLATVTSSTATITSAKNEENEAKANSKGDDHEKLSTFTSSSPTSNKDHRQEATHDDHYVDLLDIAEMDYSPARRKPPIHN